MQQRGVPWIRPHKPTDDLLNVYTKLFFTIWQSRNYHKCIDKKVAELNSLGFFVFNTNLTFVYKIDIESFKKFQQKIKLPSVGFELTTAATALEF